MFPFPLYILPLQEYIGDFETIIWTAPVQWTATQVLGIAEEVNNIQTGSGDTTFYWILFGLTLFLSLVVAAIWSVIDRQRPHYQKALEWLRVYTRYYLAFILFSYGFSKVFHLQMPTPAAYQLTQPLGDFSPMGILWAFLGASKAYSSFSGWAEVIPGFLLLFRRTTLLGALLSFAVMLNVFMLNLCYDVPVKIYSFFLMVVSMFLIAPDFIRLLRFFVLQKPIAPRVEHPIFEQKRWNIAAMVLKFLIIGWVLYTYIDGSIEGQKLYGDQSEPAPLSGLYEVQTFERNHQLVPPLLTDSTVWKQLLVHRYPAGWGIVSMTNDKKEYCSFQVDSLLPQINLHAVYDTIPQMFVYEKPDDSSLILKGVWKSDSLVVRLKQSDKKYRLLNRGFHWINERPYNR
jgi:hypothetical protein